MTKFLLPTAALVSTVFLTWTACTEPKQCYSQDSSRKINEKKWHREFSVDTLTNEKIITLSKVNRKKLVVDGRRDYLDFTYLYYKTGQLHKKIIRQGWRSGWGGKGDRIEIIYDTLGQRVSEKITEDH